MALAQDAKVPAALPIEIPFRMIEGVVWIDVSVNGSKPLAFQLDTAAGNDALDRSRAEELRLRIIELGNRNAGTGDGTTRVAASPNVEFGLGPAHYTAHAIVVPFDGVNRSFGERINGLLGFSFLSQWVVTIDYARQKLVLHPNEGFQYTGKGEIVPLRFISGGPVIAGTVVIGGKEYPGDFLVDAPYRRGLGLTTPFVEKHGLLAAARQNGLRLLAGEMTGVAGKSRSWRGRATTFRVGKFVVPGPITDFAEATAGSMMRQDIAGILGADILHHFVVTLDYPRKRLILEQSGKPVPAEADRAGILWDSEPPDYQRFTVLRVEENSPASEAGVKEGDVLLSVDGQLAGGLRKWQLAERLQRRPEANVTLRLKRGEKEIVLKLRLRRLI